MKIACLGLEVHDQKTGVDHFALTFAEPGRVEIIRYGSHLVAYIYRGTEPDIEQEPALVYDSAVDCKDCTSIALYECGICGAYHSPYWNGDCRDDENRYADPETAMQQLGATTLEIVPMPGTW